MDNEDINRKSEDGQMAKSRKAVTMSDIAKRVQVSTVTVSKALSGQKGVSEEVREQIAMLAKEMGYRFPKSREPKERRSFRIGVLISESTRGENDSFYWKMYQAVSQKAMEQSCFTGYEGLTEEITRGKCLPKLITEQDVEGLIVIGRPEHGYGVWLSEKAGIPVVFLDFSENGSDVDSFISNGFYGSYLLTDYLIEAGHEKIAFVGTVLATESITDRYMGYHKALLEHGIKERTDYVVPDRSLQSGTMGLLQDFALPEDMPTAFVCNCDVTAEQLVRKLKARGLCVPEDVSVVGFDNYPGSLYSEVGITTYEVDIPAMAEAGVNSLIRQMNGEEIVKGLHVMDGKLIEKESVGRLGE